MEIGLTKRVLYTYIRTHTNTWYVKVHYNNMYYYYCIFKYIIWYVYNIYVRSVVGHDKNWKLVSGRGNRTEAFDCVYLFKRFGLSGRRTVAVVKTVYTSITLTAVLSRTYTRFKHYIAAARFVPVREALFMNRTRRTNEKLVSQQKIGVVPDIIILYIWL